MSVGRPRKWEYDTATQRHFVYRVKYLPDQLVAARRKLAALENEARRYGMTHLLEQQP